MRIGDRPVGSSQAPFVIAEIGVNHDGSAATARDLVSAAAAAGADAVKFQYFTAERLLSRSSRLAAYQREAGASDPFAMLKALELSLDDLAGLADHARSRHVLPIVTVFSVEHATRMRGIAWAAFKTASPDIINKPLIDALGDLGKPMILSTGASTSAEVRQAAAWMKGRDFAIMQCTSAYPTPPDSAHLAAIPTLHDLVGVPVGYSDHTTEETTGGLAVAAGAVLLEKHFTLDRSAKGPDHAASLEPDQFGRYVKFARLAAQMRGEPRKIVHEIENDVRSVSRQSIVAVRDLKAGDVIRREDLTIKRPGNGLEPALLEQVIGSRLRTDVAADALLTQSHVMPGIDAQRGSNLNLPSHAA